MFSLSWCFTGVDYLNTGWRMVLRLSAHVLYGLDAVLDGGRHSGRQIHVFAFSEDGCEYRSKSTHTHYVLALVCHTIIQFA